MRIFLIFLLTTIVFLECSRKAPEEQKTEAVSVTAFHEDYRPQFHFSTPINWHNDPNGLMYYDGEYHMFYQYNPNGNEWGYMHWGHAITKDLLHWEYLPIAIYPDSSSTDIRKCTAWSGSGLVDWKNTLGKQVGSVHTLVVFYTSQQCGQRCAYSTDKGRTWTKFEGNPIIPFSNDEARDPYVRWYEPSNSYFMAIFRKPGNERSTQGISIYTSDNLVNWNLKSHVEGFFEVPGLYELSIDQTKKWVMSGGNGDYMIGAFDGAQFHPETTILKGDYGKNYWAPQTFNDMPAEDNRTIQIAWMRDGVYPGMPFNQQMTFPVELSLVNVNNSLLLSKKPLSAIATLYTNSYSWENETISESDNLLQDIEGELFHIKASLTNIDANNIVLTIRKGEEGGNDISFNLKEKTIEFNNQTGPFLNQNNIWDFEMIIDRASVEVFANSGTMVMTNNFTPNPENVEMELNVSGGKVKINSLEVHKLKSIWE